MKCRSVQRRLGAYLDGELSAEASAEIPSHVEACARCARELGRLRRLVALLEVVPAPEAPAGFARRVRALAERREAEGAALAVRGAQRRVRYAAAAALLLGVTLGGLMSMSASTVSASRTAETKETSDDPAATLVGAPAADSLAEAFLELTGESW